MVTTVDSLEDMINTVKNCATSNCQKPSPLVGDDRQARENRGGAILQDLVRQMKQTLLVAEANLFSIFHAQRCKIFADTPEGRRAELSPRNSGSTEQKMNSQNQNYTICIRMPNISNYYISLTKDPFREFI